MTSTVGGATKRARKNDPEDFWPKRRKGMISRIFAWEIDDWGTVENNEVDQHLYQYVEETAKFQVSLSHQSFISVTMVYMKSYPLTPLVVVTSYSEGPNF